MNVFQTLRRICGAPGRPAPFEGPDRRTAPRFPSGPHLARMTWQDGLKEEMHTVELLDISANGARVRSPLRPHTRQRIWLRLEAPQRTEWYEATVVRVDRDEVAITFGSACPFDLYKALRGVVSSSRAPAVACPEFDDRDWH